MVKGGDADVAHTTVVQNSTGTNGFVVDVQGYFFAPPYLQIHLAKQMGFDVFFHLF